MYCVFGPTHFQELSILYNYIYINLGRQDVIEIKHYYYFYLYPLFILLLFCFNIYKNKYIIK